MPAPGGCSALDPSSDCGRWSSVGRRGLPVGGVRARSPDRRFRAPHPPPPQRAAPWRARGRASGAPGVGVLPGGGAVRPARGHGRARRCPPVRPPRPARAAGPIADGQIRVVMVVDPGETGPRGPMATCLVVAAGTSGSKILAQRASELGLPSPRYAGSGLLCGLDGFPATACPVNNGGGFAFWAYFNGSGRQVVVRSRQPVRPSHGRRRDHGLALHHRLHRGRRPGAAHRARAGRCSRRSRPPPPPPRRPPGGAAGRRGRAGARPRGRCPGRLRPPIRPRGTADPSADDRPRRGRRCPRHLDDHAVDASAPPTRPPRPRSWPPSRPAARRHRSLGRPRRGAWPQSGRSAFGAVTRTRARRS